MILHFSNSEIFEFSRQKWHHQKCDSTYRFAHPCLSICDINQENTLKTLPCTVLQSHITLKPDTLYLLYQIK